MVTGPKQRAIPAEADASIATGDAHPQTVLPDSPVIVIGPDRKWSLPDFREFWAYRELLYFLIWRDVKIRYKQTALGAAWAILQPLLTMLIFAFIFGRVAGIDTHGVPYPLFVYVGLVPWLFFSNGVNTASNSIIGSSNLITKVYFPRMFIPASSVGAALVDFAIASLLFVPLALWYHVHPGVQLVLLPLLLALLVIGTVAVGLWLSALNVKYRDFRYVVPFALQIGMFVSPVAYPVSAVPEKWRTLYALNPLTGMLEGFRAALLGQPLNWPSLAFAFVFAIGFLSFAIVAFRRMEKSFADLI